MTGEARNFWEKNQFNMELLRNIIRDIESNGGKPYIVGGWVRDKILGIESKDIDVEVYGITPEDLEKLLSKYGEIKAIGKSFKIFSLGNYDFSLPRKEKKIGMHHGDFKVTVDPHMSIEDAGKRRDLTINSLMYDVLSDKIIDPFNGLNDLENGIIRCVNSNTFGEDALRVLRVARFASRFAFEIHGEIKQLCINLLHEMKFLPRERFMTEFENILLKSDKPSIAFKFLLDIGVLNALFPELAVLNTINQGAKYHPEGNAFEHTMLALDNTPIEERTLNRMLGVLCHDLGKSVVASKEGDDGDIHFYGHAEEGVEIARVFLHRLTSDVKLTESVLSLVKYHMNPHNLKTSISKRVIRRLALKVDIKDLIFVHRADIGGRGIERDTSYVDKIVSVYREIENEIKPIVLGRHLINLGMKPSPEFGKILRNAFEAQIDGKFNTLEEGIIYVKNIANA